MSPFILFALLAAAPDQPVLKLAAPGLAVVGVERQLGAFFSEHLAQQAKLAGADVVTDREMAALLGMERQKQLLGCSDQAGSCLAELTSALGADAVLLGDVAKVGSSVTLNLKIISALDGRTIAAFSETVKSEEAAIEALTRAAQAMNPVAAAATKRSLRTVARAPASSTSVRTLALIPAALGVVGAGVGAGLLVGASGSHNALVKGEVKTEAEGVRVASTGNALQTGGFIALSVGAAALVAAGAMFLFGAPAAPTVTPTEGGAVAGFVVVLP